MKDDGCMENKCDQTLVKVSYVLQSIFSNIISSASQARISFRSIQVPQNNSSTTLSIQRLRNSCRVHHAVIQVMERWIRISGPMWERSSCSTTTEDGEGQDENHDLGTTVQSGRSDVVVLDEQLWSLPS